MVMFKLTESDKESLIKNNVLMVNNVIDEEVELVISFLENFRYQHDYLPGLYFERPIHWTEGYIQALDKIACFFKYGDVLSNVMV